MNFLRPWAHQILWCSVPLSQTHKTEFNSKLFSCCSHISAFYVPCHCVLWNDADLSAALYFFFFTKNFQYVHLQPLTPVTCTAAGYCYGLWPWETCTNFASLGSCFLKVLIDEVRCLIGNVKFLDSCQPVGSIYVVYLSYRVFFFRSFRIKQHRSLCCCKWWSKYFKVRKDGCKELCKNLALGYVKYWHDFVLCD